MPDTELETGRFPDPRVQPVMSVTEAGRFLGIGSSASYDAAARGDIPSLHIGRRLVVPTAVLARMLGFRFEPAGTGPPHPAPSPAPIHRGKVTNSGDSTATATYQGVCSCGWTSKPTHRYAAARSVLTRHCRAS